MIHFPNRLGDDKFKYMEFVGDVKIYSIKIKWGNHFGLANHHHWSKFTTVWALYCLSVCLLVTDVLEYVVKTLPIYSDIAAIPLLSKQDRFMNHSYPLTESHSKSWPLIKHHFFHNGLSVVSENWKCIWGVYRVVFYSSHLQPAYWHMWKRGSEELTIHLPAWEQSLHVVWAHCHWCIKVDSLFPLSGI